MSQRTKIIGIIVIIALFYPELSHSLHLVYEYTIYTLITIVLIALFIVSVTADLD